MINDLYIASRVVNIQSPSPITTDPQSVNRTRSQHSYKAKAAARRTTRPPTLPPTLVAAPVKTGMFEPVGLATAMVPLTGMEVNLGPTTAVPLEAAERVTMAAALEEALDGHELTTTVELADICAALEAAMEALFCRQVRY